MCCFTVAVLAYDLLNAISRRRFILCPRIKARRDGGPVRTSEEEAEIRILGCAIGIVSHFPHNPKP